MQVVDCANFHTRSFPVVSVSSRDDVSVRCSSVADVGAGFASLARIDDRILVGSAREGITSGSVVPNRHSVRSPFNAPVVRGRGTCLCDSSPCWDEQPFRSLLLLFPLSYTYLNVFPHRLWLFRRAVSVLYAARINVWVWWMST